MQDPYPDYPVVTMSCGCDPDDVHCTTCNSHISDSHGGVQCDTCKKFYCCDRACISKDFYSDEQLGHSIGIPNCPSCVEVGSKTTVSYTKQLEKQLEEKEAEIAKLKKMLTEICSWEPISSGGGLCGGFNGGRGYIETMVSKEVVDWWKENKPEGERFS